MLHDHQCATAQAEPTVVDLSSHINPSPSVDAAIQTTLNNESQPAYKSARISTEPPDMALNSSMHLSTPLPPWPSAMTNADDSCTAPINNMNIIYNHHNQLSDSPKTVTSTSEMMAHLAK